VGGGCIRNIRGQYAGIISGHSTGGALLKCAKAGKSDG
jgi:hypothetical protein